MMSPRNGVKLQDILRAAEDIANEQGMGMSRSPRWLKNSTFALRPCITT